MTTLIIIMAVCIFCVFLYNQLISLKHQVENAWNQIDVQLKRRHELIPNLVNTVKAAMNFEQETLEKVILARNQAVKVSHSKNINQRIEAESSLEGALSRLMAVVESYPELSSMQSVLSFQEELTSTENKITFARQLYNDLVSEYNTKQDTVPSNLIASFFAFKKAVYFNIENKAEREVPNVDFSS
jgi:LemA protein